MPSVFSVGATQLRLTLEAPGVATAAVLGGVVLGVLGGVVLAVLGGVVLGVLGGVVLALGGVVLGVLGVFEADALVPLAALAAFVALVALAAVAASPLPLHPLNAAAIATVPTTANRSERTRAAPNPRLAFVIKTPELCDPDNPVRRERSRQLKRVCRSHGIPQLLTRQAEEPEPGNPAVVGFAPLDRKFCAPVFRRVCPCKLVDVGATAVPAIVRI